ncbi:proteoglycan 4b isoform X1 [Electrophorus electricus]|uniref:proteoglycan 4b isoform X1 n=1 Tax=Electrophorus electricus TaxID=8005 RepID=UPI0015CFF8FC|nr:proteoglycan 4b isoform X1 [Electrophorus electricus]XP_035380378.1 proteoglycan 4b isoform X1 [Electrophorus electricus]
MTTPSYLLLAFAGFFSTCCSAQTSCRGRCAQAYYRGSACQCDSECLAHNECCPNYESLCTTRGSCRGRCGERFKRGRTCHCDGACAEYHQCCSDYESACTLEESSMDGEGVEAESDAQEDSAAEAGLQDLNEAVVGGSTQAPPPPVVASGSGALSSEDVKQESSLVQPTKLPDLPEVLSELNEGMKTASEVSEAGGDSPSVPDESGSPVPTTPDPPFLSPARTISKTAGMTPPSVDEEDHGSLVTEPEWLSLISSPFPSELVPTGPTTIPQEPDPNSPASERPDPNTPASERPDPNTPASELPDPNTPASERPDPNSPASERPDSNTPASELPDPNTPASERPDSNTPASERPDPNTPASELPKPNTPASELPKPNTQPSPQRTSESRVTPATTAHTNATEITASSSTTEPEPSNPEQPKDTLSPEGAPGAQTEHTEPIEMIESITVAIQNKDPTDKSNSTETTSNAQDENIKDLPSPNEDKPEANGPTSGSEIRPFNPDQPGEAPHPEDDTQPHRVQHPSGPSENTATAGMEAEYVDPTDKPSTAETTTNVQDENMRQVSSIKETSTTLTSLESTPAKVSPPPTKATKKPTNPTSGVTEALDEDSPWDYQADAANDTDLCSGRPINGLTTLRNGTIVVFRGHYFWTLDSRRNPGPAHGITDVWGIPSPIDTVYTRCNCQGKTYFFKGNSYWRFENGLMDPGFPKPISEGFGVGGHLTAALSMPRYRSRRESVLFFKRGGLAQRYTYLITPQCGSKLAKYTTHTRVRREKDSKLGQEINIQSWKGFPPLVTAAVSVPATGGEGYRYYIFSRTKYYNVKMQGDAPVILTPKEGPGRQRSARSWFRCPKSPSTYHS